MGLLKVLPDTGIEASSSKYNIEFCSHPPYQVLSTKWLKHTQIRRLYLFGECFEAFYNNPYFKTFFRYIANSGRDCISFFNGLLDLSISKDFFSLAKTQPFLNEILFDYAHSEPDKEILEELLIYDWLSCGHRFLPKGVHENLNDIRNGLYKTLPETVPDLYDRKTRNFFFKKNIFYKFSGDLLKFTEIKEQSKEGHVVFLPSENKVIKKNKCLFLG